MEYDTLLKINKQHQTLKIKIMQALSNTLPESIDVISKHELDIENLEQKIQQNQIKLKELETEIQKLNQSKNKLL